VQELLGHADVSTIMIYTHVMNKGARGVRSPLDRLEQPPARYTVIPAATALQQPSAAALGRRRVMP
jgi:hypothetical protein